MEPRFEQTHRQEQRLALTPQVKLGLHILQLSLPELKQFVDQQLEENPVLQEAPASSPTPSLPNAGPDETFGRVGIAAIEQLEHDEEPKTFEGQEDAREKRSFREHLPTQPLTLREHLLGQLHYLALSPAEAALGEKLIDNLDEHGYLEVPLEELAKNVGAALPDAERCLKLIQEFDPPGVGARDLRECLLIQLRSRGKGEESLTLQIVRDHFELVRKRGLKAIARHCSVRLSEVQEAFRDIQALDPKPGRAYGGTLVAVLVPDAMIERVDGAYEVSLRREELPRLRISRYYRNLLKDPTAPDEVRQYLKEKVDGALWLMKAIGQRNLTLKEIVRCIACLEEEFLDKGPAYLKPLTLEQVAQLVGRHKSTVCRAVANKYLQTPWGIVPLERFFGGGLRQDSGAPVAEQHVKAEIRALIEGEDPHTPLADQELVDELKTRGVTVARRTVAKYREELTILPSHLRKALC
ncbi:MAG: RNA polymerase factor sigma-54 [Candidatus Omnitrophica bacterium]|nr:RNA polymerase factor sigma-54 [Candidatus Omnitrophota bacterium]